MTTVIAVVLIVAAVGLVSDQLLRLRKWLNKAPPPDVPPPQPPPPEPTG